MEGLTQEEKAELDRLYLDVVQTFSHTFTKTNRYRVSQALHQFLLELTDKDHYGTQE